MSSKYEAHLTDKQLKFLQEFVASVGVQNHTISFSPGTAIGENFLGIITQVDIKWNDDNGQELSRYYLVKCAPVSNIFRTIVYVEDCYARETYTYSKVFFEFSKIQQENGVLARFQSYPVFFHSMLDYKHEMLIFQNMKRHGFQHWKREQPLDFEHISLIMQELGRLHALSYATRHQKPALFVELVQNTQEAFYKDFSHKFIRVTYFHRMTKALESLDPIKDKVIYERFANFTNNMYDILTNALHPKTNDGYGVIGHGDCGISNYLFKYDIGSETPTQVCMLDWQMARFGSPALDLSCVLFACTDKKLRDQHYHNFIAEYYNSFGLLLKDLGCDGEKLLPFEVLQHQLKQYSVVGLFMSIPIIYIQTSNPQEIPDIFEDSSHADGFAFLYDLKDKTKFNTRVRDVIMDFDRLGYDY